VKLALVCIKEMVLQAAAATQLEPADARPQGWLLCAIMKGINS
jgi:hypothetical protein